MELFPKAKAKDCLSDSYSSKPLKLYERGLKIRLYFGMCIIPKPPAPKKTYVSFLLAGGDIAIILLITSIGI